jgi:hypothetical protein
MLAYILTFLGVTALVFIQNTSFTLVSRSRNRDSKLYHCYASIFSNGVWYATIGLLNHYNFKGWLAVPYIIGAVTGSLFGMTLGIWFEKRMGLYESPKPPVATIPNRPPGPPNPPKPPFPREVA